MQLDGTETLTDIRDALRHVAATLAKTRNRTLILALRKQQDDLLDAELRIKRKAADC